MCTGNFIKLYAPVTGLILLVANSYSLYAEEFTAFKITDIEGYVGLNYRYDGELTEQTPGVKSKDTRSIFEEEINVLTHGYLYHPNLLKVNLGATILFYQEDLEEPAGASEHDDTLYGLNARLMFLEKKPYPLTLYYDKSHPTVALNVTDVFIQENEKYGINFSVRQPISPVTLDFESYKEQVKGNSFTQVTNDKFDFQSVRATSNFDNGGHAQLSYTDNQQQSMSGSIDMPIEPFNLTTETTNLNSLFVLGMQREINFSLIARQTIQKQDRGTDEIRVSPSVTWEHSANFNSFYSYSFLDREQVNLDTLDRIESQDRLGTAGLRYQWNKNLYSNAEMHFNDNKTTGLALSNYGASGSITYKHQLGFGVLQFNVGLNYDEYDRDASGLVQKLNEAYTLSTTSSFTLANDYVDRGTIEVRRQDTNETLDEGTHYRVEPQIGNETRIIGLSYPGADFPFPVVIDYQYDPGGDATYNSIGQSYQTSLEIYKHFTVFLNYRDQQQNLKSGEAADAQLESSDTTTYGFRVNYPLPTDMDITVGGELLNEKHNENISSYQRNTADLFMQMALPLSSDLYLSMQRQTVDNLFSVEDVDLTRYALRLNTRPANRFTLSLQFSDEKDIGGSLARYNRNTTLTGQWRIRKLILEFAARKQSDRQGAIKHDRSIFNLTMRREF